jgi:hypothetical protein
MVPEPRWTIPVNIRSKDKPILDAVLNIAKSEGVEITTLVRTALAEFVTRRNGGSSQKLDNFLADPALSEPFYYQVLSPSKLNGWDEEELLRMAKLIRARKEELDSELRRRGYLFRW